MLKGYLSSGQPQLCLPKETFTRAVASSERLVGLGKPTFIRLNPRGDLACMICEMPRETQISLWSFSSDSIIMEHHWKLENFGNV